MSVSSNFFSSNDLMCSITSESDLLRNDIHENNKSITNLRSDADAQSYQINSINKTIHEIKTDINESRQSIVVAEILIIFATLLNFILYFQ